jgi:hypothetical protein
LTLDPTDGTYHLNNVMGMNNKVGSDNVLTNYLAHEAIQYAIEATYELNYFVDLNWKTVVNLITMPVNTIVDNNATFVNILQDDSNYTADPITGIVPLIKVLEPLIVLMPYYSRDFFTFSANYNLTTIKTNLLYYMSKQDPAYADNAINKLIIACIQATVAQREIVYADKAAAANAFYTTIQNVFSNSCISPWQTFTNSMFKTEYNDIGVSSLFLLTLLTSVGGLRVNGGITEMRFYYEDMGIVANTANVMPKTWKQMTITGVGSAQKSYDIVNQLYYP